MKEISETIETWGRWYSNKGDQTYEDRLEKYLAKAGCPYPLSKLADEELLSIFKNEKSKENRDCRLIRIIERELNFRLRVVPSSFEDGDVTDYFRFKKRLLLKQKQQRQGSW